MPKESVYDSSPQLTSDQPRTFQVDVLWGRENGIQVATVDPDAMLGSPESGLFVDLDRGGVNELIRHLRRARDQAFGRDE